MNLYFYDEKTHELIGSSIAYIDPMASKRLGKTVYSKPSNSTFIAPPELKVYQIAIFDEGDEKWIVKDTYKGHYKINIKNKVISLIETTDELKSYERLVTKDTYEQVKANPDEWDVVDGELINIAKTQKYQSNYNIRKYKALIKSAEDNYEDYMNTPVEYFGMTFLPRYIDDYAKLINRSFPMEIWDATGKKSKLMTLTEFKNVKEYLEGLANSAYLRKKTAIRQYRNEIEKLEGNK